MLSPQYLEGTADDLVDIYAQLETDILQDMARRIAKLGKITDTTKWQSQMLAEAGGLKRNIEQILKKYDKKTTQAVTAAYTSALNKSTAADNRIFKEATGRTVGEGNAQQMLATIQKAHSDLSRLTLTTATTSEQTFVQQANRVYMDVQSGAFDYDTAVKSAANEMAKRGITTVQYENSKPVTRTIESAVRMNVLTGINQTASAMSMNNCDELGCDLVETSAHLGARPEHEAWQGQIFSLSGTSKKYPPFSVCRYGEADGICGINCRHSFYPYFEDLDPHYTADDLDEMSEGKVTYNGKEISRYEGEQGLRKIERNIRKYKRQALTQEAAGVDSTGARRKIGEWQATARDFTKQTGIQRDSAREYIGTAGGKQPTALKPKLLSTSAKNSNTQVKTNIYGKATDMQSLNKELSNFSDYVNVKGMNIESANKITMTLENLYKDIDYKKLKTINITNKKTIAASSNYKSLDISKNFINNSKDFWATSFGNGYTEKYKNAIVNAEKNIELFKDKDLYRNYVKELNKEIDKYKEALKYKRHNVLYEGQEIESTISHELGHVIADQKIGQINHQYANVNFAYNFDNTLYKLNLMIDNTYRKAKSNGDIYKISSYATSNSHEFFAECFTMYRMGLEKLPDYIENMIKEVIK